jgi:hypothetical protein
VFKDINVNNYIIDVFIPDKDDTMCKVKLTGPQGNRTQLSFIMKKLEDLVLEHALALFPRLREFLAITW